MSIIIPETWKHATVNPAQIIPLGKTKYNNNDKFDNSSIFSSQIPNLMPAKTLTTILASVNNKVYIDVFLQQYIELHTIGSKQVNNAWKVRVILAMEIITTKPNKIIYRIFLLERSTKKYIRTPIIATATILKKQIVVRVLSITNTLHMVKIQMINIINTAQAAHFITYLFATSSV